jgi:hypothetical protein
MSEKQSLILAKLVRKDRNHNNIILVIKKEGVISLHIIKLKLYRDFEN